MLRNSILLSIILFISISFSNCKKVSVESPDSSDLVELNAVQKEKDIFPDEENIIGYDDDDDDEYEDDYDYDDGVADYDDAESQDEARWEESKTTSIKEADIDTTELAKSQSRVMSNANELFADKKTKPKVAKKVSVKKPTTVAKVQKAPVIPTKKTVKVELPKPPKDNAQQVKLPVQDIPEKDSIVEDTIVADSFEDELSEDELADIEKKEETLEDGDYYEEEYAKNEDIIENQNVQSQQVVASDEKNYINDKEGKIFHSNFIIIGIIAIVAVLLILFVFLYIKRKRHMQEIIMGGGEDNFDYINAMQGENKNTIFEEIEIPTLEKAQAEKNIEDEEITVVDNEPDFPGVEIEKMEPEEDAKNDYRETVGENNEQVLEANENKLNEMQNIDLDSFSPTFSVIEEKEINDNEINIPEMGKEKITENIMLEQNENDDKGDGSEKKQQDFILEVEALIDDVKEQEKNDNNEALKNFSEEINQDIKPSGVVDDLNQDADVVGIFDGEIIIDDSKEEFNAKKEEVSNVSENEKVELLEEAQALIESEMIEESNGENDHEASKEENMIPDGIDFEEDKLFKENQNVADCEFKTNEDFEIIGSIDVENDEDGITISSIEKENIEDISKINELEEKIKDIGENQFIEEIQTIDESLNEENVKEVTSGGIENEIANMKFENDQGFNNLGKNSVEEENLGEAITVGEDIYRNNIELEEKNSSVEAEKITDKIAEAILNTDVSMDYNKYYTDQMVTHDQTQKETLKDEAESELIKNLGEGEATHTTLFNGYQEDVSEEEQFCEKDLNCLNKSDIALIIMEKYNISKSKANKILNALFDTMSEGLLKDGDLRLRELFHMSIKKNKKRKGRNPKTGEEIDVPSKKVIKFKMGKELFEIVNK